MNRIAVFGAGPQGRAAAAVYLNDGIDVVCFIDNDEKKQGSRILDLPVLSVQDFSRLPEKYDCVIICCPDKHRDAVISQLKDNGIKKTEVFRQEILFAKDRFISYSYPENNEDLILYHVLKDEENIFWIDIGSYDPYYGSVTQAFYERGHSGINIDIEKELILLSQKIRPRDINLCVGIGKERGRSKFYYQGEMGGLNTMVASNVQQTNLGTYEVDIVPLKEICEEYVKEKEITFLKIDVEGMEKDVLLGADFDQFRPYIIVIESTLPCTEIENYEEWEYLLLQNDYQYVYSHGVNRYYVAKEKSELAGKFIPFHLLAANYCVFYAKWTYVI